MEHRRLAKYVREAQYQCELAGAAYVSLHAALALRGPNRGVFQAAQSSLTAAAQISKLMWFANNPDWSDERRRFAKERSRELRKVLKPAAMLNSRSVRNAIEHFDERLDDLLFTNPNVMLVDNNITPKRSFTFAFVNGDPPPILRHFDPETLTISVLGDDVSLREMQAAMSQIQERAGAWLREHERPI